MSGAWSTVIEFHIAHPPAGCLPDFEHEPQVDTRFSPG